MSSWVPLVGSKVEVQPGTVVHHWDYSEVDYDGDVVAFLTETVYKRRVVVTVTQVFYLEEENGDRVDDVLYVQWGLGYRERWCKASGVRPLPTDLEKLARVGERRRGKR